MCANLMVIFLIQRLSYFPGHITRQTQVTRHLTVPTLLRRHLQAGVWGQQPVTRRLGQRGWRWRWRACSHNSDKYVFKDSLFYRTISSDAAKQRTRQYLKACVAIFLVMSIIQYNIFKYLCALIDNQIKFLVVTFLSINVFAKKEYYFFWF